MPAARNDEDSQYPEQDGPGARLQRTITSAVSRREVLAGAGGAGLLAAAAPVIRRGVAPLGAARTVSSDGTPEQLHLTWGNNPAASVSVSWSSPGQAQGAKVVYQTKGGTKQTVAATQRTYTDGLNGEKVWTYHATLTGLSPATEYTYSVTAANDSNRATPLSGSFTTAPSGRSAFRFTSFGDLATPNTQWVLSYGQAAYAVAAVESFQPLFHLLNGDLCYADLNPSTQPEVWADFGNNNQTSAANRPWMPCLGNHEIEFDCGPQGYASYLTRYQLPSNRHQGFNGRWYSFQVGGALFITLDANDVVYQDAGPLVSGPDPLDPAPSTGNAPIQPGTSFYVRGYSGGEQTRWLKNTLRAARQNPDIDWIIVQMHQCIASSSNGNGSDWGIRTIWSPLFDQYKVDIVVNGHDHDYERSFPTRGFDSDVGKAVGTGDTVQTNRPHPITTVDGGEFDTSKGTVHLVLGGGGTDDDTDDYGVDTTTGKPTAKVFTYRNAPTPSTTAGEFYRPGADTVENATWSARRNTGTGYGIGVFDVDPGTEPGGRTSITFRYYQAKGADPSNPNTGQAGAPNPKYTHYETVTFHRARSDG